MAEYFDFANRILVIYIIYTPLNSTMPDLYRLVEPEVHNVVRL